MSDDRTTAILEAAAKMRAALSNSWLDVLFTTDGLQPPWMRDLEKEIEEATAAYDAAVRGRPSAP